MTRVKSSVASRNRRRSGLHRAASRSAAEVHGRREGRLNTEVRGDARRPSARSRCLPQLAPDYRPGSRLRREILDFRLPIFDFYSFRAKRRIIYNRKSKIANRN